MLNPRRWAHRGCAPIAQRIDAELAESAARFRERIEDARRQYPEAARLLDPHRTYEVRKVEYATRVNVDAAGKPMCNCCAETMVEIKPGTWMCALGAAALTYLESHREPEPHLGHALGGPSPEPDRG